MTQSAAAGSGGRTWRDLWIHARRSLGDEIAARRLAEEVSGFDGPELVLRADEPATGAATSRLHSAITRLQAGEPLQHVLGHWGFRELDLAVGPGALIPRPETEIVVEVALAELRRLRRLREADAPSATVVELGTGTGAIALTIASEEQSAEVWATDYSPAAMLLASANCVSAGRHVASRVHLLEGDWFGALPAELAGHVDLVISNPPYVSQEEWTELDDGVRLHDPYEALVPGPSGTEAIALIIGEAPQWLAADGLLVLEIGSTQGEAAVTLSHEVGLAAVRVEPDLSGRDRVLVAHR